MDDAKRYNGVLFLRDKKEAADRIEEHAEKVKRRFGVYPKYLRFDNGKELVNARIKEWAAKRGIENRGHGTLFTVPKRSRRAL